MGDPQNGWFMGGKSYSSMDKGVYPHFRKPPYMKHIIYDRSAHMFFHPNRMAGPAPSYTMELVVTT